MRSDDARQGRRRVTLAPWWIRRYATGIIIRVGALAWLIPAHAWKTVALLVVWFIMDGIAIWQVCQGRRNGTPVGWDYDGYDNDDGGWR